MKKENHPPIIHIGFPKTATKWFQHQFYPCLPDSGYIDRKVVFNNLIRPDIWEFDEESALKVLTEVSGGHRILICEELLVGGLDIGFGLGEFINEMAHRIKRTFPNGEIVIFIRNQEQIILSAYSQYVKAGGTMSLKLFIHSQSRFKAFFKNHHLFSLKFFEYDRVISLYASIFGVDKIHIFLYEEFAANQEEFIANFRARLGFDSQNQPNTLVVENKQLSKLSLRLMRFFNRFTYKNTPFKNYFFHAEKVYYYGLSITSFIDSLKIRGKQRELELPREILSEIREYYRASNNCTANYIDFERLKRFNYPL